MYLENDHKSLERYSSAITLSDMEVFIFPELLYSLVLANIMSPRLWRWRTDPWFDGSAKQSPVRRVQRLKQFIMDKFTFNLDLDTWGLTTKEREISRFKPFIDTDVLSRSNALFGYEGDKYYFDIDIRKHFGLEKYTSATIPYWKTETLEAMEAFRHKEGYTGGAGECVSLSTLYAAAAFAVGKVSLDDIFIMATPLHSQGYLDVAGGIITNNRRIVTKTMWFNGTEISAKARRALENEAVTIVSHRTGHIHLLYPESTIEEAAYARFSTSLSSFMSITAVDFEIIANFLRHKSGLQKCFQMRHTCSGKTRYIEAEKVFSYEHSSKLRVSDDTRSALLREIEEDEFYTDPIQGRIPLWEIEEFFKTTKVSFDRPDTIEELRKFLTCPCYNIDQVIPDLKKFCTTTPDLPQPSKSRRIVPPIDLDGIENAAEAVARLDALRGKNEVADLAFAAYRDLNRSAWKPFIKAALERNPVCRAGFGGLPLPQVIEELKTMPDESIYDESSRIAQPDEVWNFRRGDGLEKAILLANILAEREPGARFSMKKTADAVILHHIDKNEYSFRSGKEVKLPEERDFTPD